MVVQPFLLEDISRLKELQPPDWPDITPHFEFYLSHSFCFPIKVISGNKIVGIGCSLTHPDVSWLSHIIVHPDFRNKGMGNLITQALLDRLKPEQKKSVYLVSTKLGKSVYLKLGFMIESEYLFFKSETPFKKFPVAPEIKTLEAKHHDQVYKLDLDAFGEDRKIRLAEYLKTGFVFEKNDRIEGFYLPDLVEGLIVATMPEAGLELMKYRIGMKEIAVLPEENKMGIDFLIQNNFNEYRRGTRMRIGKKIIWKPELVYNRISGQIG